MSADFTGGPGFLAFVVTFSLVVAGILLFLSLSKHLRKVRARDARERAEAEKAAGAAQPDRSAAAGTAGSAGVEGGERGGDQVAGEPGDRE